MKVFLTPQVTDQIHQIARHDPKSARIIFDHIKKLPETYQADPFLKGPYLKGLRRNRVGRYRAIYRVVENEIRVIAIDHRKSIYEN